MAKAEWGAKRCCPKCSSKFYDMNKNPVECPVCHFAFDPNITVKKRTKRKGVKMKGEDAAEKVLAKSKVKGHKDIDEDEIDLPEIEDLGIIEEIDDLDDMEEMETIAGKPETEDDSEDGIEEDKLLDRTVGEEFEEDEEDEK